MLEIPEDLIVPSKNSLTCEDLEEKLMKLSLTDFEKINDDDLTRIVNELWEIYADLNNYAIVSCARQETEKPIRGRGRTPQDLLEDINEKYLSKQIRTENYNISNRIDGNVISKLAYAAYISNRIAHFIRNPVGGTPLLPETSIVLPDDILNNDKGRKRVTQKAYAVKSMFIAQIIGRAISNPNIASLVRASIDEDNRQYLIIIDTGKVDIDARRLFIALHVVDRNIIDRLIELGHRDTGPKDWCVDNGASPVKLLVEELGGNCVER